MNGLGSRGVELVSGVFLPWVAEESSGPISAVISFNYSGATHDNHASFLKNLPTRQVSNCTGVFDKYSHRGVTSLINRSRRDGPLHIALRETNAMMRARLHKIINS